MRSSLVAGPICFRSGWQWGSSRCDDDNRDWHSTKKQDIWAMKHRLWYNIRILMHAIVTYILTLAHKYDGREMTNIVPVLTCIRLFAAECCLLGLEMPVECAEHGLGRITVPWDTSRKQSLSISCPLTCTRNCQHRPLWQWSVSGEMNCETLFSFNWCSRLEIDCVFLKVKAEAAGQQACQNSIVKSKSTYVFLELC